MVERDPPRLLLAGPMLGVNPGWVTTQGEILANLLAGAGYPVQTTSPVIGRAGRLADTVRSLVAWRKSYDLVILSVFGGPGFYMADATSRLARWLGKPMITVLHGGSLPRLAYRRGGWVRRVLGRAAIIVAPSNFLAEFARQLGLAVAVIPNVIALQDYPFRLRSQVKPRLLWMRTFEEIYHPEMAVEVLNLVRQAAPQARLTMAGQKGDRLEATRALAGQIGLDGTVRFAGFLDQAGKSREFAGHDIFLNTNHVDNTPVSVLEAAAFGLPVVATQVGGVPYLLENEKNALLVADNDTQAMAAGVLRLLREDGLAEKLSRNGRVLAEASAWENVLPAWRTAIRTAASSHP